MKTSGGVFAGAGANVRAFVSVTAGVVMGSTGIPPPIVRTNGEGLGFRVWGCVNEGLGELVGRHRTRGGQIPLLFTPCVRTNLRFLYRLNTGGRAVKCTKSLSVGGGN